MSAVIVVSDESFSQFAVYGSTDPNFTVGPDTLLGNAGSTLNVVHNGLKPKQAWYYRVMAIPPAGSTGPVSAVASATPVGSLPTDFDGDRKEDVATFLRGDSGDLFVARSAGDKFLDDDRKWHEYFAPGAEYPLSARTAIAAANAANSAARVASNAAAKAAAAATMAGQAVSRAYHAAAAAATDRNNADAARAAAQEARAVASNARLAAEAANAAGIAVGAAGDAARSASSAASAASAASGHANVSAAEAAPVRKSPRSTPPRRLRHRPRMCSSI
jgi:hypothetical protein